MSDSDHAPRWKDAVDLGYEINEALGAYLDAPVGDQAKGNAEAALRRLLWDNMAGIVAGLLGGSACASTGAPSDRQFNNDLADDGSAFPSTRLLTPSELEDLHKDAVETSDRMKAALQQR